LWVDLLETQVNRPSAELRQRYVANHEIDLIPPPAVNLRRVHAIDRGDDSIAGGLEDFLEKLEMLQLVFDEENRPLISGGFCIRRGLLLG
jgi:hypothetical protein